jgi:hypothetical protein
MTEGIISGTEAFMSTAWTLTILCGSRLGGHGGR